ncbi:MAG: monovalent cation/H+ antiporter complex subunit F [Bacteriovoracaceae bacterium]
MSPIEYTFLISKFFLFLGILLALIRFLKGPKPLDRIIALDMIAITGLGLLSIFMIESGDKTIIDIILTYSILPFVGTASLCTLIYKKSLK